METNKEILEKYKEYRQANSISKKTIYQDINTIDNLIRYTKNKNLKDITGTDTQGYIGTIKTVGTRTVYSARLIKFYRWLFNLKKRERPENMEWFEYPTAKMIRKQQDPDVKKYLITDEEYNKMIQFLKSDFKWSALFETLYLSGARPNEIMQMNIKDVDIDDEGTVTITLTDSKTQPRRVPLPETPKLLNRWLENHPYKNKPDTPLWISHDPKNYHNRMNTTSINNKMVIVKKYTSIKGTLSPHCFRKTRATIYFSSRNPTYDDSEISKIFGWEPWTVSERRKQYDLRNFDDLKNKIQGKVESVETFDIVKSERDSLVKKQEAKISKMEKTIKGMEWVINRFTEELKMTDPEYKDAYEEAERRGLI